MQIWFLFYRYQFRRGRTRARDLRQMKIKRPALMHFDTVKIGNHGLRTPNEGINQRYLKNWADVADKICFGRTLKFGIGIEFSAVQWRLFLLRVSVVRDKRHRSKITDWTFWLQIDNAFLLKEVPAWETQKSKIQNYWLHRQRERQMSLALVSRDELCLFERDFIFQGKLQTNLQSLQTWWVSSPRLSSAWLACPKVLKWTAA